jgi:hypothetical protein
VAAGGAVASLGGTFTATDCLFQDNHAQGGSGGDNTFTFGGHFQQPGMPGYGGALAGTFGTIRLEGCQFLGNKAAGGDGGPQAVFGVGSSGGGGFGGGIAALFCRLEWTKTILASNAVAGGYGGRNNPGGAAAGGGAWSRGGSDSLLEGCRFEGNNATGGNDFDNTAGAIGSGGGLSWEGNQYVGTITLNRNTFLRNSAIGGIGSELGQGGGLAVLGSLSARDCLIQGNSAVGGAGFYKGFELAPVWATGGQGQGGGLYAAGACTIQNCALIDNQALGGTGRSDSFGAGDGGTAYGGGAYYLAGTALAENSTVSGNRAEGGRGGTNTSSGIRARSGDGHGGGVYGGVTLTGLNLTVVTNQARGTVATGSNLEVGYHATLLNSILVGSTATGNASSQVSGPGQFDDGGHNICSDKTCGFTEESSQNNLDAKLGPLGLHGGLTPSYDLLSGSPAIDAGDDVRCPPTDQRGVSRPQLAHCDIGAVEFIGLIYLHGQLSWADREHVILRGIGKPGSRVIVQHCPDLSRWTDVAETVVAEDGSFECQAPVPSPLSFYRATSSP